MERYEGEFELIEYLKVLWKRRWLIIFPTIFIALVAGIVSFLVPPVWEVDAIIQPSKYFVQSTPGAFMEVIGMDPRQLAGLINQGSYNRLIGSELNLDPRKFPRLRAESLRDTKLVRVSTRTGETDKAKAMLDALFRHIKVELDRKIDGEMKGYSAQVAAKESEIKQRELDVQAQSFEIEKIRQRIIAVGSKLKISEEHSLSLAEEMKGARARANDIEKQWKATLAEKQGAFETLGLLLYANEVQQNIRYYNALEETLSAEKVKQEDLRLFMSEQVPIINGFKTQIDKIHQTISALQGDVEFLNERKNHVDYTLLVKEPTASLHPVSPRKAMNVIVAGFLGLFCFSVLAFILDAVEKRNVILKSGS